jgi:hypothetical protein
MTRALLEKVSVSQRKYMENVEKLNHETVAVRRLVKKQLDGFRDC